MMPIDPAKISQDLRKTLDEIEFETKLVYEQVVKPSLNQSERRNTLPNILHVSVMWCFARIDLLSAYWKGAGNRKRQSLRMVDFMEKYMAYPRDAASMALHMWRHNMMHTGYPRTLFSPKRVNSLTYTLQWGEEMDRSSHFVLAGGPTFRIEMALFYLIEDLKRGQEKYLLELSCDSAMVQKFEVASKAIEEVSLKVFQAGGPEDGR